MQTIFEATRGMARQDFTSADDAKRWVEEYGHGQVTKFHRDASGRERSCALDVYTTANGWRGVDISR